jgi:hypothetical protein
LLIDATYTPVNHDHLSVQERDKRILNDLPVPLEELREYVGPDTGVVLVKANVGTNFDRAGLSCTQSCKNNSVPVDRAAKQIPGDGPASA